MKKAMQTFLWLLRIFVGTGLFSVGFNMFWGPMTSMQAACPAWHS